MGKMIYSNDKINENKANRPILTIAVPTYNGANTIRAMLDILIPQITDEVEVIISDNCSTDNTQQIISEYKVKCQKIQYFRNKENLKADGNFLQCMKLASGKFTMLISDDDIIVEGAIKKIIKFLKENPDITLAHLETVSFKDKYEGLNHCKKFELQYGKIDQSFTTTDKKLFFDNIRRQWGFTSSFLWSTDRCHSIKDAEKYFNTYWLQSYIHILCSDNPDDLLGIIAGPIVAAGEYGIILNYDVAEVEALKHKEMLDFAVTRGYDEKQLEKYWIWRVCYIGKRAIIKERSVGRILSSNKIFFTEMNKYPYAWIHLFPYLLLPRFICRIVIHMVGLVRGKKLTPYVNRE